MDGKFLYWAMGDFHWWVYVLNRVLDNTTVVDFYPWHAHRSARWGRVLQRWGAKHR